MNGNLRMDRVLLASLYDGDVFKRAIHAAALPEPTKRLLGTH
jgi:hypothetical protein